MAKRDWFYGGGSVVGIASFITHVLDLINKPNASVVVTIAVFVLLTAMVIASFWVLTSYIYKDSINTLKESNKIALEQLNKVIKSQDAHITNQESRYKRIEPQDTSKN